MADFSVLGYLDASADTQWLRVMPIRPFKLTSAGVSSDVVTLEEHGTGRMTTRRDSVFTFNNNPASAVSGSAWVHNFRTSQPIDPGARYTLSIQGDSRQVATDKARPGADGSYTIPVRRDSARTRGDGHLWSPADTRA